MTDISEDVMKLADQTLKSLEVWNTTDPDGESDQRDIGRIARAIMQDRESRIRSCLIDKPEAGEAEHDVVEEGAKILAKWLRYAWDGLQDRDISAEYPDWTHNSFGGYQLQGGKPALRKVASAILALSSPLSAGDTGEDHARGCEGRSYTCTCGYDDARDAEIDRLRRELEEARALAYAETDKGPMLWKDICQREWDEKEFNRSSLAGDRP